MTRRRVKLAGIVVAGLLAAGALLGYVNAGRRAVQSAVEVALTAPRSSEGKSPSVPFVDTNGLASRVDLPVDTVSTRTDWTGIVGLPTLAYRVTVTDCSEAALVGTFVDVTATLQSGGWLLSSSGLREDEHSSAQ